MPEQVEMIWEGANYGRARDRRPGRFRAFVPDCIAEWDGVLSGPAADAVARATGSLAALDASSSIHDLEVVAGPLLRAEAVGSSFIEGLRSSQKKIALATFDPKGASETALAVLGNIQAMERAIEIACAGQGFTVDSLLDLHRVLLTPTTDARLGGVVRREQNWVGGRGNTPLNADFVPPPFDRVPALLNDLIAFISRSDLPAVAQAAVTHAQFETIHPFLDGNGRAGRCLIHVVLRRREAVRLFVPPVSIVLARNSRQYIGGLTDFRSGYTDQWVGTFADALVSSCEIATELSTTLDQLVAELTDRAGPMRKDAVGRKIIAGLPGQPIVSADSVAKRYSVSEVAARVALNHLEKTEVLQPVRVGSQRNREWTCDALFKVMEAFEAYVTRPTDGSTAGPFVSPTWPSPSTAAETVIPPEWNPLPKP